MARGEAKAVVVVERRASKSVGFRTDPDLQLTRAGTDPTSTGGPRLDLGDCTGFSAD